MSFMSIDPDRSSNSSTDGVVGIAVKCTAAQLESGPPLVDMQWPSLVQIWLLPHWPPPGVQSALHLPFDAQ